MSPRNPIVPFRATEEDREIIAFLQERTGTSVAEVIRAAIRIMERQERRKDK